MELREYLFRKRMTATQFARILDMSPITIQAYNRGKLRISKKLMRSIQKHTNGEVTVEEMMKTNIPKKVVKKEENEENEEKE